jgi:hypothetical protein
MRLYRLLPAGWLRSQARSALRPPRAMPKLP